MHKVILSILIFFAISSCVVNKKYQYLQKDDVNVKPDQIKTDTVLRKYQLDDFEYHLQAEDIISVQFYSLTSEEYNFFSMKQNQGGGGNRFQNASASLVNGYLIDESGAVEFPVVGKVKLAGLTVFEAQNHIRKIATPYLESPIVEVRLLNFRYTLLGEVKKEGVYNNLNNRINVLEAIGLSGGFTDLADKSNVKIIRQKGRIAEVYYVNLLEESFLESPQLYVNQLDVIVVPPLKQRPYQNYFSRNVSLAISTISLMLIVINLIRL